ncbi:MAG: MFS transporter [Deltaproteobacteria bacterium]|nr:MFS transporter [Deltaproteobacteria bacterium]
MPATSSKSPSGAPAHQQKKTGPHYSWIIVGSGLLVLFACLGLGRFSLGMLLPAMGGFLKLSHSQMGLIGTGNFVGYMVAVALAGKVAGRLGTRTTITWGLLLVAATMLLISRAGAFAVILGLYFLTGVGSGLANVPMMGLISHWFRRSLRGRAAGVMLSGNGLAIIFAGFYIPYINRSLGLEGWRTGWWSMGLMTLAAALIVGLLLRNHPREKGLEPLGVDPPATPRPVTVSGHPAGRAAAPARRTMIHLGLIYSLFGATYVVYATFIVVMMVQEKGFGEGAAGTFWAAVGALSLFSGPLFGSLSDRIGRRRSIMLIYGLFTIAYLLVAARLPNFCLYLSIGIFGLAVWSIPTIMAATVGDYLGAEQAPRAFGFITLFFGVGQIIGPATAGYLADLTGSFRIAFWLCAMLTGLAVLLTTKLKKPA